MCDGGGGCGCSDGGGGGGVCVCVCVCGGWVHGMGVFSLQSPEVKLAFLLQFISR